MDPDTVRLCLTFAAGVAGVAAGWAGMRGRIRRNAKDIAGLRRDVNKITGNPTGLPVYIRRDECATQTSGIKEEIGALADRFAMQDRRLTGLQNFARYLLITKEGLSLTEVNDMLNGS